MSNLIKGFVHTLATSLKGNAKKPVGRIKRSRKKSQINNFLKPKQLSQIMAYEVEEWNVYKKK